MTTDPAPPGGPARPSASPATPELNAVLRAGLDHLLAEYGRVRGDLSRMRERLRAAQGEAESKDGAVRVTVGPRGELRSLSISPRAYRRLSPSELAAEILELTRRATGEVHQELEQVMAPFLPEGVSYQQVVDGDAEPASWASRQPLTLGDFGRWWSAVNDAAAPGDEGRRR